jgi:hemerythrin-like metal-binding protein
MTTITEHEAGSIAIDVAHANIRLLLHFVESAIIRQDLASLFDALTAVMTAVRQHLSDEERVMFEFGYENLEGHKLEHVQFMSLLSEFRAICMNRSWEKTYAALERVIAEFRTHITTTDAIAEREIRMEQT